MTNSIYKAVRIVTLPACMALLLNCLLFFCQDNYFSGIINFIIAVLCLTVLPLLAYPVAWLKKGEEQKKRNDERTLCFIFSTVGYLILTLFYFIAPSNANEKVICLTYLFSCIISCILNFGLKIKSSAHSCGVSGPIAMLTLELSPCFAFCYLLLIPVFHSSLKLKRHTFSQLIIGSIVPIVALFLSVLIIK